MSYHHGRILPELAGIADFAVTDGRRWPSLRCT